MGQVVEAFRFLSSRVATLEQRLASEDRPVDGPALVAPAGELGPWVEPVAHACGRRPPCGASCTPTAARGRSWPGSQRVGVTAHGVEPRERWL